MSLPDSPVAQTRIIYVRKGLSDQLSKFGYLKIRFRGLVKNTTWLTTLFALSNLWIARKHMKVMGELRV